METLRENIPLPIPDKSRPGFNPPEGMKIEARPVGDTNGYFYIPEGSPQPPQAEQTYSLRQIIESHRAKQVAEQDKRNNSRNHLRHKSRVSLKEAAPPPEVVDQVALAEAGAERYEASRALKDTRVADFISQTPMYDAFQQRGAKKDAMQTGEMTEVRQSLVSKLSERARSLPTPFRRR